MSASWFRESLPCRGKRDRVWFCSERSETGRCRILDISSVNYPQRLKNGRRHAYRPSNDDGDYRSLVTLARVL